MLIPELAEDLDGLGYLHGKDVDFVNKKKATDGVLLAHTDGGVPNMFVTLPEQDESTLGYIFTSLSWLLLFHYLNGINPFDQPGVEAYKKTCLLFLGNQALKSWVLLGVVGG